MHHASMNHSIACGQWNSFSLVINLLRVFLPRSTKRNWKSTSCILNKTEKMRLLPILIPSPFLKPQYVGGIRQALSLKLEHQIEDSSPSPR